MCWISLLICQGYEVQYFCSFENYKVCWNDTAIEQSGKFIVVAIGNKLFCCNCSVLNCVWYKRSKIDKVFQAAGV